jgi:hypothetical protein
MSEAVLARRSSPIRNTLVRRSIRILLSETQGRERVTDAALALEGNGRSWRCGSTTPPISAPTYRNMDGPYTAAGCDTRAGVAFYRAKNDIPF